MTALQSSPLLLFVALGLMSLVQPAAAGEIYKWLGRDGSTWFSEQPPSADMAGLEVLQVTAAPSHPPADTAASSAAWRQALEVANRLQADRLAREQARLEREALRLRQRELSLQRQQQARYAEPPVSYFVPYYGKRPRHFPHTGRPHRGPGKAYGGSRPPRGYRQPMTSRLLSNTQQAQRPAIPAPGSPKRYRPD